MTADNGRVHVELRRVTERAAAGPDRAHLRARGEPSRPTDLPHVELAVSSEVLHIALETVARDIGIELRTAGRRPAGPTAPRARTAAEGAWVVTDDLDARGERTILVVPDVAPPLAQRLVDDFQSGRLAAVLHADEPLLLRPVLQLVARGQGVLADRVRRRAAESPRLDERQLAVLRRVARGRSNSQIGRELHLSATTVKRVVTGLLRAFECATRIELAAAAWDARYLAGR